MDRVLAFGCHPDDIELSCAGTLALLKQKGYEIHFATMAGGEVGSPDLCPQAIRAVRLQEAANAAKVLGGTYHYAGGCDLEVEYNSDYRKKAVRVVREVDPLIVFTHSPMQYLIDHEETSRLVRNAAYIATVRNYDCGVPTTPTRRFAYLYYWSGGTVDALGRPVELSCMVDISTTLETKAQMCACHESQRQWLSHLNKVDNFVESMKQRSAEAGKRIGAGAAEGFIQHRGSGHPQDNILKQILGDLCVEI